MSNGIAKQVFFLIASERTLREIQEQFQEHAPQIDEAVELLMRNADVDLPGLMDLATAFRGFVRTRSGVDSPTSTGQIGAAGTFGLNPAAWPGKIRFVHDFQWLDSLKTCPLSHSFRTQRRASRSKSWPGSEALILTRILSL